VQNIEKIIFKDLAKVEFYDRLDQFHECFVDNVLLSGVCPNGSELDEIPFTKNSSYSLDFFKTLIGGFQKFKPKLSCRLINKKRLELECLFYDFGSYDDIKHVYMIQNVMDWTSQETFSCQIWNLLLRDIDLIRSFWYYTDIDHSNIKDIK
jgi:hypothetical protein